jgi:hypothetical protein
LRVNILTYFRQSVERLWSIILFMAEKFFYMHGQATHDLEDFTLSLFSILAGQAPNLNWRSPETQRHYISLRENRGEESIIRVIKARMQGQTMALLENDFPYDALMPLGGAELHAGDDLAHYCLWSTKGSLLVPENIDKVIDINFSGLPALVFMHGETHKSIKDLDHAHIVVDGMRRKLILEQRYFHAEDFI